MLTSKFAKFLKNITWEFWSASFLFELVLSLGKYYRLKSSSCCVSQAIDEDPQDALQWHQMGLHTLCTLQFGAAQKFLKTSIARQRSCSPAWTNLGTKTMASFLEKLACLVNAVRSNLDEYMFERSMMV